MRSCHFSHDLPKGAKIMDHVSHGRACFPHLQHVLNVSKVASPKVFLDNLSFLGF